MSSLNADLVLRTGIKDRAVTDATDAGTTRGRMTVVRKVRAATMPADSLSQSTMLQGLTTADLMPASILRTTTTLTYSDQG